MLDDIFVLCRAFEQTFSSEGGQQQQARVAVVETIKEHGLDALPDVRRFVDKLRAFETASPSEFAEWFASENDSLEQGRPRIVSVIRTLREAAAVPGRWNERESRRLGRLIYQLRCAVVHPSLDTHNSLALPVLPVLRDALIELTIACSATRYRVALLDARRQFAAAS